MVVSLSPSYLGVYIVRSYVVRTQTEILRSKLSLRLLIFYRVVSRVYFRENNSSSSSSSSSFSFSPFIYASSALQFPDNISLSSSSSVSSYCQWIRQTDRQLDKRMDLLQLRYCLVYRHVYIYCRYVSSKTHIDVFKDPSCCLGCPAAVCNRPVRNVWLSLATDR